MTELEKWQRMTNPKSIEDYSIGVNLNVLFEEDKNLFLDEVGPKLVSIKEIIKDKWQSKSKSRAS